MPKVKKKLTVEDSKELELLQEVEELEEKSIEKEIEELEKKKIDVETWLPKTTLGKHVKEGRITDIDEILDNGTKIMEAEIVDILVPELSVDLLLVGQSKGKFGGGSRRIFRQVQKKTAEGNKPRFATVAIVGNQDGYFGLGYGKSKETVPARDKAIRNAKLNIMKIKRGCGSWQCGCGLAHSIPFAVQGKCGSVIVKLIPAPKGTGLIAERECAKLLKIAGIKDVWSKTFGSTTTKLNTLKACVAALKQLTKIKIKDEDIKNLGIVEGRLKKAEIEAGPAKEEVKEET